MSDFISDFKNILMQLFNMQVEDTPNVLRHVLSQIMRFGTLAFCIAAVIFAVQTVILIFNKKSKATGYKNVIYTGVMCVISVAISVFVFLPVSAAPSKQVTSGAFQNIQYEASLFEQAEQEDTVAEENTEEQTQGNEAVANSEVDDADGQSGQTQNEEPVILSHTELSQEYTDKVLDLLKNTDCTRTLMRELPSEDSQKLILRLENGDEWNIMLTSHSGYIFIEENVNFIYTFNDYAQFHAELASILEN